MNSIPLTFNEHQINRTTIGGMENTNPEALNISVILLGSEENHFKTQTFENLLACNFKSIISIEKNSENFSLFELTKKFPEIKFIIPQEEATDGELINIAMGELKSDYVIVLRDNLNIPSGVILTHLADRLTSYGLFCVVPRLLDYKKNTLPCHYEPTVENGKFAINSSFAALDGAKTVFPFDYIALYNRQKFINLGGFDYTIQSPYWQIMDLAIRSWLWGEQTKLTTLLQFSYVEEIEAADATINMDYLRFYLKNQLPKIKMETGYIKLSSFLQFYFHSGCGFLEARRQFIEARKWVKANKYMFKMDLQTFVKDWS